MSNVQVRKEQAKASMSTISVDEDDGNEQANLTAKHHNRSLPYFLSALQLLGVDILNATWQPALEGLGRGKYTFINQSLISDQMNFAFKRWDANSMYDDIVSEIAILSIPSILDHPNINPLLGICWEIVAANSSDSADSTEHILTPTIKPVLVTPKSPYGSLRAYLERRDSIKLDLNRLLRIYVEIAHAINALHMCSKLI
jgi:Protein tyrosine and serine/threonine kinase